MFDTRETIDRYLAWRDMREGVVHDVSSGKFVIDEATLEVLQAAVNWDETVTGITTHKAVFLSKAVKAYVALIESDD